MTIRISVRFCCKTFSTARGIEKLHGVRTSLRHNEKSTPTNTLTSRNLCGVPGAPNLKRGICYCDLRGSDHRKTNVNLAFHSLKIWQPFRNAPAYKRTKQVMRKRSLPEKYNTNQDEANKRTSENWRATHTLRPPTATPHAKHRLEREINVTAILKESNDMCALIPSGPVGYVAEIPDDTNILQTCAMAIAAK